MSDEARLIHHVNHLKHARMQVVYCEHDIRRTITIIGAIKARLKQKGLNP